MVHLICTPSALGPVALVPQGAHIRQTTRVHVTNTKCITLRGWITAQTQRCTHLRVALEQMDSPDRVSRPTTHQAAITRIDSKRVLRTVQVYIFNRVTFSLQ